MLCIRHLAPLTLIVLGSALLSLQLVQSTRAAYAPAHAQAPQRKPAPVTPETSKPVAPNAPAATITVSSLADGAPANNSQCTLRESLINANNNDQSGSTDCAAGSGAHF